VTSQKGGDRECAKPPKAPFLPVAPERPLLFGAFELKHYRPTERPDCVHVVHPKTGEEAWWPLFDEAGRPLFPELMTELDEIKTQTIGGHIFRRDHKHRRGIIPLPWITARGDSNFSSWYSNMRHAGCFDL
jgi:hypothetical protein